MKNRQIRIEKVAIAHIYPLRNKVLRNGKGLEFCQLPMDDISTHYALYVDDAIASIATIYPEDYPQQGENAYRLRGMATDTEQQGQGLGALLLAQITAELKAQNIAYLWCNARKTALNFYHKLGFEIISDEFEVPGIGPHYDMKLILK